MRKLGVVVGARQIDNLDDSPLVSLAHESASDRLTTTDPGEFEKDIAAEADRTSITWLTRELEALRAQDEELLRQAARYAAEVGKLDKQLRLAAQIQRDLLPDPLPTMKGVAIHVLYRPAEHVSGDVYNVQKMDETHLALTLADATGHGVPAALLSVFVKQVLRCKQIESGGGLVGPADLLQRLNDELVETRLTNNEFVAIDYAVYDGSRRQLEWVRGGAPFPILIRPGAGPTLIRSGGTLIGATDAPTLETVRLDLHVGDTVLFYTDGLDNLLLERRGEASPREFTRTAWFERLGHTPITEAFSEISAMLDEPNTPGNPIDDVTLLAIEVTG